MRRSTVILLCLITLLGLCGCTRGQEPAPEPQSAASGEAPSAGESAAEQTALPRSYAVSELLPDVPGQGSAALLSVRSDGTVDYIFHARTREELEREGLDTLAGAGCRYYVLSPDGTAAAQPTDWMERLDEALRAADAEDAATAWTLSFSACEGHILILAELRDRAEQTVRHTALYHLYENELTQIPLRWTVENGAVRQIPRDGFYAMADGVLIWDARAEDGAPFYRFAFDGSPVSRLDEGGDPVESPFGVGQNAVWLMRYHQVAALDREDGTALAQHAWSVGATIRGYAVTPDGGALYLLSNEYGKTTLRLERFAWDNAAQPHAALYLDETALLPAYLAAANNGTLYLVTEDSRRAVLRQYCPE